MRLLLDTQCWLWMTLAPERFSAHRYYRDPFDRILVAQAQIEALPLVTADPQLLRYDVEVIKA